MKSAVAPPTITVVARRRRQVANPLHRFLAGVGDERVGGDGLDRGDVAVEGCGGQHLGDAVDAAHPGSHRAAACGPPPSTSTQIGVSR